MRGVKKRATYFPPTFHLRVGAPTHHALVWVKLSYNHEVVRTRRGTGGGRKGRGSGKGGNAQREDDEEDEVWGT